MNTSSPMKQKTILNHGFMICSMELDLKKNKIKNCVDHLQLLGRGCTFTHCNYCYLIRDTHYKEK